LSRGNDLSTEGALGRVGVLVCVALLVAALIVRFPLALDEAGDRASANAGLGFADRELGGGNSVVVDQQAMYEAQARIPEDEGFEVALGERREGWSELTETGIRSFSIFFLLPRRERAGAPWVICYGCDRSAYPGFDPVWEGEESLVLLRRSS
jgi:hypothetical protein